MSSSTYLMFVVAAPPLTMTIYYDQYYLLAIYNVIQKNKSPSFEMSNRCMKNKKWPYGKGGQLLNMTRLLPCSPARWQVPCMHMFCPPPPSHGGLSFPHPHSSLPPPPAGPRLLLVALPIIGLPRSCSPISPPCCCGAGLP